MAFSKSGLTKVCITLFLLRCTCTCILLTFGNIQLGFTDSTADAPFEDGQFKDAALLGDKISNWLPAFQKEVHGIIVIASDEEERVVDTLNDIGESFGFRTPRATMQEVFRVMGNALPGGREQYVIEPTT